jgi:hypothetical protein
VNEGDTFPGIKFTVSPDSLTSLPSTFNMMAVSLFRGKPYDTAIDEILFTTLQDEYRANFFSVYELQSNINTAIVLKSIVQFSNVDISGAPLSPANYIATGFNSSRWFVTENYPFLWGNRNNAVDRIERIESAWQIFYPWQKIILRKTANHIDQLTNLATLNYPEFPHTEIFYYSNQQKMLDDIGTSWGLEVSTNFTAANTSFGGFYFNSYLFDAPLRASSNSTDYQYIALRNYAPTEQSEVLVRFILNNQYTFGYITLSNLGKEASLYKSGSLPITAFDPTYARDLSNFDNAFHVLNYWGSNIIPGFPGSNIQFSTFNDFSQTYSNYYVQFNSNLQIINGIQNTVKNEMSNYITTSLKGIIPNSALNRQQFTDPLQFSMLWKSSLLPLYQNLRDNWGLGFNLGFLKQDTPYSTVISAQSFYKIIDDYIYLRLNNEYDLNRLDFSGTENLAITRESTGSTKTYYGKLLLNNFNSFSQTFVQNPVTFNPSLPKLEQLYFEWDDITGVNISNTDCEWNISVQITEELIKGTPPIQTGGV